MDVIYLLLVFFIMIECTESEKPRHKYVVQREDSYKTSLLPSYIVFDSTEIRKLYQVKTYSADVAHPEKNIV